jgi:UrcA family protein
MNLRLSLAIAVTALIACPPAFASAANATAFEASIAHDDLDLTTGVGAARLDERVRTKIRQMCRNGGRDGASVRLERECRETALAATTPAVRVAIANARLERVRLAKNGTPSPAATPGV